MGSLFFVFLVSLAKYINHKSSPSKIVVYAPFNGTVLTEQELSLLLLYFTTTTLLYYYFTLLLKLFYVTIELQNTQIGKYKW